ncbi:equilibrative nucleoside transporter 3-like isoform X2 [Anneissia japonica]|uniref:equilibrative nucleoside transporter 3-like isoform X2 n=1 Tax=Anneissia japonica TaxID=1529436 RepID=UPI0014255821|nr:equilibrative nucleoside transporter 3-like isoform X2 [Anneissia japonica]
MDNPSFVANNIQLEDVTPRNTIICNDVENGHAANVATTSYSNGVDKKKIVSNAENTCPDRWNLVYWIMVLHGVGVLLPWNMFITAEGYFTDHKFGNLSSDVGYKDKFVSYLGIAAFTPNITLMVVSLFFQHKTSRWHIPISLVALFIMFIITTLLAVIDTNDWPRIFFMVTMASIVLINGCTAIYQSGMFGIAARFPSRYMQGYVIGQGLGGTFVALISILSIAAAKSLRNAAIGFFGCACLVIGICFISYNMLFKLSFSKYYIGHEQSNDNDDDKAVVTHKRPPYGRIFVAVSKQLFNIWLTFFVTLAVFPPMLVQVEPATPEPRSTFFDVYFTPVTCFFMFNFLDFLGSCIPGYLRPPPPNYLWIPVAIRLVFFPIFMFCNYRPETRTLPVFFLNDYLYIGFIFIFSISNGYLKTAAMVAGAR